jgi:hypothetical protein
VTDEQFPRSVRVVLRVDGQMRVVWMAAVPRLGEYVGMGDNVRRHVAEVRHNIDPENVPVTCWLEEGDHA